VVAVAVFGLAELPVVVAQAVGVRVELIQTEALPELAIRAVAVAALET
jgi:hypothetical protein